MKKTSMFAFMLVAAVTIMTSQSAMAEVGYGGSSHHGGGTKVIRTTPAGEVLGASTSTATTTAVKCEGMYLKSYMRMGQQNDQADVVRLQAFLNSVGIAASSTGVFDAATDAAVRKFQTTYMSDVLAPWKITNGTGYVYKTTRAKINNIVCPGSEPTPKI
jgi:Putative peptidoglycan binding domain